MLQEIIGFFNSADFMPHGHCFLWQPGILWLHVLSDAAIVAAYYAIPGALLYFIWKRKDLQFGIVFWLFAAFILLCGTTHLFSIWVLWHPDYAVEGVLKALTGIISIATFFVIVKLMPKALLLPSNAQLSQLNMELQQSLNERMHFDQVMQESKMRHQQLIDSVQDYAIYWLDLKGKVESWNSGAERIKGYTAAEIIGRPFSILYTEEDQKNELPQKALDIALAKGKFEDEGWRVRKDGTKFWANVSIAAIHGHHGEITGFAKVTRDITDQRKAKEELANSRMFLQKVMDAIPDPIFVKDQNHVWKAGNKSFWEMMGGPAEQFIGKNDHDIFPPEQVAIFFERDAEVFQTGATDVNEESVTNSDGSTITALTTKSPLTMLDGTKALVGVVRDITDLKKAEQALKTSEETFRSALEHASIGMALVAPDGKFITVNKALCEITGFSREELLKTDFQAISHPDDIEADLEHVRQMLNKDIETYNMEKRYLHKDGRFIWALLSVSMIWNADGTPKYFISQIQDITERKEMERMKSDFIATVSHELRTPLTAIRGSLALMANGSLGVMPGKAAGMVKIAHKNSERLVLIINDILDIEKIESGRLQFNIQPVNIAPFLVQALETNQAYGEKFKVEFVLEGEIPDVEILADQDRLMQVMANLLSNAAKFSPTGSKVRISATHKNNKVRFEVKDSGPGIPEEFRSRIFGKFMQADSSITRKHEGTGLGLSITRQLVELMGGSIGFTTEIGKGTVFYFDLPEADSNTVFEGTQPMLAENVSYRVLICEDDDTAASLLKAMLEQAGFMADIAFNIPEARRKLKTGNFTGMILDIMLPMGDGTVFLKELRADPATEKLPVVVVSARADEAKAKAGDGLSVADWLNKPVDHIELIDSLCRAIDNARVLLPRVLHIEDDKDLSRILAESLRGQADLISATTIHNAEKDLKTERYDLVVLDPEMPDGSSLNLIKKFAELKIPVVILSASEMPNDIQRLVAATLVKSRMSEAKIAETIMNLIKQDKQKQET